MSTRQARGDEADLLDHIGTIFSNQTRGFEKPHKGLLLLLVLAHFRETQISAIYFSDLEKPLKQLISRFSNSRQAHAEYPFWALQNDRLWEVFSTGALRYRKGGGIPSRSEFIRTKAVGKIPFWIETLLRRKPDLIARIADSLLKRYFARGEHREIRQAVGLTLTEDATQLETGGLI